MLEKHHGELTQGCKSCFKGEKLVLFITGVCPRNCFYCPISKERKNNDIIFVNEWQTSSIKDLIEEAKAGKAKGAGITGGDPLARFDRTLEYIKALKKEFGKNFHIHLYTSLDLLTKEKIKSLEEAGLDELRVHPDIEDKSLWPKLELMTNTKMETVVEIPAIPKKEKQMLELISYAKDKVQAFNLNELEFASLGAETFKKNRWKTNENYSIKGSERTAMNVFKKARAWHLRIHYCSAKFKDEVQFSNRIMNYAKSVAKSFDIITPHGTLFRGAIYPENKEHLKESIKKLENEFPKESFLLEEDKSRILCSVKFAKKNANSISHIALIEEYPTRDRTEIYCEFLS